MKRLYTVFLLALVCTFSDAQTQREYSPTSAWGYGISGGSGYCQGATANPLTLSWADGFCQTAPSLTYIPITITWYSNPVASTSGGTVVSTINTNAMTTSTSYTPSTAVPGSLFYYVTISWNTGVCTSAGSVTTPSAYSNYCTVYTYANPIPSLTASPNPVCAGTQTTLTAGESMGWQSFTYSWAATSNPPSTNSTSATSYTVPVTLTSNNTYTLTVTDLNGCSGSTVATVSVNPTPVASLSASPATICTGNSSTLTAGQSGGSQPFYYTWTSTGTSPADYNNTIASSYTTSVSPTVTTTYTLSVTDHNNCVGTTSKTITVNSKPTVTAGASATTVCAGTAVTLTGGGTATSYAWTNSVTDGVAFTPAVGTIKYIVTGTNGSGCSDTASVTVKVNALPTVTANASATTVCEGSTVTLTGSGTATTYTWTNGATNGISFAPPAGTTKYTVTGTNSNGCSDTASVNIDVNPLPAVTANASDSNICFGTTVTLSGSGTATSYSWTGGIANGVAFTPSVTNTYTVTGTDANNCVNTGTVSVSVSSPATPEICLVTVDSASVNNIIYWDKTLYNNADSFFVYRDTANNNYALIGKVPYDSMSMFVDTLRTLYGGNGGDPNASSWRYKLAIKDSCGNVSAMSPYHQTLFMQHNNGNFNWSDYKIEGQTVPVPVLSNYRFLRDDNSTGVWNLIQQLSASSTLYTDASYSTYEYTANWRVEATWTTACNPTYKTSPGATMNTVTKSRSNIKNNMAFLGINNSTNIENSISIYPNPAKDELNINHTKAKIKVIEVRNVFGQIVLEENYSANPSVQKTISLSELNAGIYFVTVVTENGKRTVKKIVKE